MPPKKSKYKHTKEKPEPEITIQHVAINVIRIRSIDDMAGGWHRCGD